MSQFNYRRKIIQISALRVDKRDELGRLDETATEIIALCDDGTVWTMFDTMSGNGWVHVAPIPQGALALED
ncbi:hypothetical protein [Massilia sp. TSP1-1-2]|uniref:hypothetical protein n=1 Tax=Massilia sp. TSP1-1-2 TaxID=2804649 RepID=UPI003CEC736C